MAIKNETRVVSITSQGKTGDGMGILDDLPMYVSNCIPGDLVQIKVVKVEKRRAYGKLLDVLEPSPNRVQPRCYVAAQCGGCQLQHQSYDAQLSFKQTVLMDRLGRFVDLTSTDVQPMIPSKDPYEFRNKMQFSFAMVNDQLLIGLYAARSHRVVDAVNCPIMAKVMNDALVQIRKWHQQYPVSVFDESTGEGILRHVTIRYSMATQQVMIILTVAEPFEPLDEFINALVSIPGMTCIFVSQQGDSSDDMVLGKSMDCIWQVEDQSFIEAIVFDLRCRVSPRSFIQGNGKMIETLYQTLLDHLNWDATGALIDLYCGTGILTMVLAKQGGQVIGVDDNQSAIDDAIDNAHNNELDIEFICQTSEDFLLGYDCSSATVVMDPPRQGCHPGVLKSLLLAKPKMIGIISCNVDTLGRDLRVLMDGGYDLTVIQSVDMFCHTSHLEVVVVLSLK